MLALTAPPERSAPAPSNVFSCSGLVFSALKYTALQLSNIHTIQVVAAPAREKWGTKGGPGTRPFPPEAFSSLENTSCLPRTVILLNVGNEQYCLKLNFQKFEIRNFMCVKIMKRPYNQVLLVKFPRLIQRSVQGTNRSQKFLRGYKVLIDEPSF